MKSVGFHSVSGECGASEKVMFSMIFRFLVASVQPNLQDSLHWRDSETSPARECVGFLFLEMSTYLLNVMRSAMCIKR